MILVHLGLVLNVIDLPQATPFNRFILGIEGVWVDSQPPRWGQLPNKDKIPALTVSIIQRFHCKKKKKNCQFHTPRALSEVCNFLLKMRPNDLYFSFLPSTCTVIWSAFFLLSARKIQRLASVQEKKKILAS